MKLLIIFLTIKLVSSGKCPPKEIFYPCLCSNVSNIQFICLLIIN